MAQHFNVVIGLRLSNHIYSFISEVHNHIQRKLGVIAYWFKTICSSTLFPWTSGIKILPMKRTKVVHTDTVCLIYMCYIYINKYIYLYKKIYISNLFKVAGNYPEVIQKMKRK